MSSMEAINDEIKPNSETPADLAKKQAKRVFIGFAATITIGLVVAGWYVGGRIFAAEKVHAASAMARPVTAVPVAVPAPVVAKPVEVASVTEPVAVVASDAAKPETAPVAPAPVWNRVEPQVGDLYLQLATMGPNSTNEYLQILDAKGIHPQIAPGPSENLHRLVIGPYPDKAALEEEQRELESAGIEFIAHRY
jgi:cell division septation protein DedD